MAKGAPSFHRMAEPERLDDANRERAPVIGLELVIGLVVAVLAGALFGWLGEEVLEGGTQALDDRLRALVNQHATPT